MYCYSQLHCSERAVVSSARLCTCAGIAQNLLGEKEKQPRGSGRLFHGRAGVRIFNRSRQPKGSNAPNGRFVRVFAQTSGKCTMPRKLPQQKPAGPRARKSAPVCWDGKVNQRISRKTSMSNLMAKFSHPAPSARETASRIGPGSVGLEAPRVLSSSPSLLWPREGNELMNSRHASTRVEEGLRGGGGLVMRVFMIVTLARCSGRTGPVFNSPKELRRCAVNELVRRTSFQHRYVLWHTHTHI